MLRALYTAASGMNAQQSNIDNVAHNLANVNTAGYKKSRMEFQDLVYQQAKVAGTPTSQSNEAPIGLEIGVGTKPVATSRDFSSGNLRTTQNPLDLAIEGQGFFQIQLPDGTTGYTRSGAFHLSGDGRVVTNDGFAVLPALQIPAGTTTISVSKEGLVSAVTSGNSTPQQVGQLDLASFQNPGGLRSLGGNMFAPTTASGEPTTAVPGADGSGTIAQGFLEDSNVSVVEEMINMIMGQRAYEANARVVKAADDMLTQVNNMAR
jgi:flagellar basal-body rod protein FlgG